MRLRRAFAGEGHLGFGLGPDYAIWPIRQASCMRSASGGCVRGDDGAQE